MNPEKEDPNNHVPAVMPDDDWDGLDVAQALDSQLPPRRSDAPKKTKLDVNLSAYKGSESVSYAGTLTSVQDEAPAKSSVLVNVNAERLIPDKDDFQASLLMENMKQDSEVPRDSISPPVEGRLSREERNHWGGNRQKGSSRWMLYTAMGVIAIIALTIFLQQMTGSEHARNSGNKNPNQPNSVMDKSASTKDLGVAGELVSRNKDAIQIYRQYAQAQKAEDILEYTYLRERNSLTIAKGWKPLGAHSGWVPPANTAWKTLRDGETFYAELRGVNHDYSKFIAVFRFENSSLKLDWKATTGYGTAGYDELKIGQGDGSEIRGWISPSDFFTQELSDDRYHSFIVRSPDKKASIWAYTEIGSEVDKDILELFSVSPITGEYLTEVKVILNLDRGEKEILPRQWMVENLLSANWLDLGTP